MSPRALDDRLEAAKSRLPPTVGALIDAIRENELLLFAGGLAFYGLISIAPFVVIGFWIAGGIVGEDGLRQLGANLDELAPGGADVSGAIDQLAGIDTGIGVSALIAALWPATAYGGGLVRAFERISQRPKRVAQGLRGRAKALLFVILLPVFVLGALATSYLATNVLGDGALLMVAGWALALIAGTAAGLVTLAVIYRVFGPDPLPLRSLLQGAGAAAAAISVMSLGYIVYLGQGADFEERVAGSGFAAVVLLALWLYLANAILLTGFCLARSCAGETADPDEVPGAPSRDERVRARA
ncbi:MAG TPA: YihY/virulence factor BrkB family protein [Acidimicrobiales bacterium]|nr:YihY/virulence factor BrkB family protein [Acidimicrobiales bacterium]